MFRPVVRNYSALRDWRENLKGQKIVATNGCFDILHRGHIENLTNAACYGDKLVVGLNSDQSVRQLKGPGRPICNEEDRARVLSALRMVDCVFIFNAIRCTEFLSILRPDVYVKGGDYTLETMDAGERQALENCGARIIFLPRIGEYSTSGILANR